MKDSIDQKKFKRFIETLKYAVVIVFGVGPRLLRIIQMKRAHILPMDKAGGESLPPLHRTGTNW